MHRHHGASGGPALAKKPRIEVDENIHSKVPKSSDADDDIEASTRKPPSAKVQRPSNPHASHPKHALPLCIGYRFKTRASFISQCISHSGHHHPSNPGIVIKEGNPRHSVRVVCKYSMVKGRHCTFDVTVRKSTVSHVPELLW